MELDTIRNFAEVLADTSGTIIRQYYRTSFTIDDKQDASPVTIADREAEQAVRDLIKARYPDHGIIGEEFGIENPDAYYQWVIDPIDGTKSFMIGRPIFGTLIALTYQGQPVLGVIDQPILKERWIGVKGMGLTYNGKPIRTRSCEGLSQAILCTTAPELFTPAEYANFQKVAKEVKYVVYGGDCYSYGLLAMGMADIVIESGLKPHDFCALSNVVNEAGGSFTDWQGRAISLQSQGQVLALGDKSLLSSISTILQQ